MSTANSSNCAKQKENLRVERYSLEYFKNQTYCEKVVTSIIDLKYRVSSNVKIIIRS